jgi:hypothetical protein
LPLTIAELRTKHGREPTKDEVDAVRDAVIRRANADMTMTAILLQGDNEQAPAGPINRASVPAPSASESGPDRLG